MKQRASFLPGLAVIFVLLFSLALLVPDQTVQDTETDTAEKLSSPVETASQSPQREPTEDQTTAGQPMEDAPPLSLDEIPEYAGEPYVMVNGNIPYFPAEDLTTQPFERYSPLDSLGRCGTAYANISRDTMPAAERGTIGDVRPSGWHTVRYDDLIDGRYLYNRCHLIGFQLAGENANEKNLITGTRYMNVTGMVSFENKTASYIRNTGNHVLYRVTPIFDGDNLLASGVLMEACSLEDSGEGICFNVFCYNVQPGITIDYATGDSFAGSAFSDEKTGPENSNETDISMSTDEVDHSTGENRYILNTNTKKFHYPTCSSVSEMKEKNKREYIGNREDIIQNGYVPCKLCNP